MLVVITGATGIVGRSLIDELVDADTPVRAVSRNAGAAALPSGVEVVDGDPSKPATLAGFLDGADGLFVHPRAVGDGAEELVALAARLGVRRVVALTAANIDDELTAQPSRFRGDRNRETEDAVVGSGLEWVSLRASSFASNALTAWGHQIRAGDVVRYVHAAFEESPIHERDLGAVGARALLTNDLLGQRLELTGPQSLSHAEMVAIIGEAIGRPLRFEEVPPEAAERHMVQSGLPGPFVAALMARYAAHLRRPQHPPTGEVERILGRPALTFSTWVTQNASAFASNQAGVAR